MKKGVMVLLLLGMFLVLPLVFSQGKEQMHEGWSGPSAEDIKCLEDCIGVGCDEGDENCMRSNSKKCEQQCGVKPEPSGELGEGEQCVQDCMDRSCVRGQDYANCIELVRDSCDKECGMIGEPEAQGEEEQCIRDCINKIDSTITCLSGTFEGEGERGNEVCQKCAKSCEYLYSGPCLSDEEWTEKENVCITQCEHCYGAPISGPSGQGWDCTIDIKCEDASAEFGDDPGTGEDNWEEGHAPSEDNIYWGDYKSDLEILDSEATLSIRNTNIKNIGKKVEVNIYFDEGISLEKKDKKLIVKNNKVEVEIDNNLDKLIISDNGNKRKIKDIKIEFEERKPIYRYEEKEKAKLLGFIPVNKNIKKRVDAENMEMLEENGPWWEFLASEQTEQ